MKKFKFSLLAFMTIAMFAFTFTACSDDDDPNPNPDPEINESDYHFDLFLTLDKHGGMSNNNTTYVNSSNTLTAERGIITIERTGSELGTYTMESISKGKYYYQIPYSEDRFTKCQIINDKIVPIKERPFAKNVYKKRAYTHTWLNDNTLLIMSATGDTQKIIWTKLNTDDMTIIDEGELSIEIPEGWENLTTSGILTYRKADDKLFYFYYAKKGSGRQATKEDRFRTAVIAPSSMEVLSESIAPVNSEMAGSAYGELMQNCVMYDEAGNLYIACFNKEDDGDKIERGMLLRIKVGETTFEASYNGYANSDGKLMTVQYLGNNKALAYARKDIEGTAIDSYSHYYSIIDINTGTKTRLSYNGKEVAYSGGRFSQRSVIFNNKLYIGVDTENDDNSIIYIYDIKTGTVEKGAEVAGGLKFDMIRVIENDK